jgi:hypothetical protein
LLAERWGAFGAEKYIDKSDKRFAADRASEKVIAHKAKQKNGRKIAA